MSEDIWVVAGKPKGTPPVVGELYEIRDSRKGTFNAKVLEVGDPFATVEVFEGKPKFMSLDYKLNYNGIVSVRASLAYFIPLKPANKASSGRAKRGAKSKSLNGKGGSKAARQ